MQELVKIENNQVVVSSRDVAEKFQKLHKDVLESIRQILAAENSATKLFFETTFESRGKQYPEFLMNRDGFSLLAMGFTGKEALQWKLKYIEAFNRMEQELKQQFKAPTTLKEALRLALEQQEKIEEQQKAIEEAKPKVLFAEAVASSKTTILIGELAKMLKQNGIDIGQNKLFAWLRDNGYLIKRQGSDYNMPSQYSMNLGLFEIKETSITHADGHITINRTPKVTGKGQQYFINKFLGEKQ